MKDHRLSTQLLGPPIDRKVGRGETRAIAVSRAFVAVFGVPE